MSNSTHEDKKFLRTVSWIRLSFQAQIPWNLTLLLLLNKGSLLTTPNSVGVTNRLVLELYCVDLKLHISDTCIVYLYPMFNLLPELLNVSGWNFFSHQLNVVTDKQRALKKATGLFHSWSKDCIHWWICCFIFCLQDLRPAAKERLELDFKSKMESLSLEIERTAPNLKALDQYESLREKEKESIEEFDIARKEGKEITDKYNTIKQQRY